MTDRHERSTERTRERLLEAATLEFAERGYHGASVGRIAKAASVTPAMINHHFGGKKKLFHAIIEGFGAKRIAMIQRHATMCSSAPEFQVRLEVLVSETLHLHIENLPMVHILMRDAVQADLVPPELQGHVSQFLTTLAEFMKCGQEAGLLRKNIHPLIPASLLYYTLATMLQLNDYRQRVRGESMLDDDVRRATVKQLIDVVLNGVLK